MIPGFLRALAALLRELARQGKLLHATEADAVELELLSGLLWERCRVFEDGIRKGMVVVDVAIEREATPADVAFGWLWLSRAQFNQHGEIVDEEVTERSAVCAELAVIAAGMTTGCSDMGCSQVADPHRGTREGARAAWSFIIEQFGDKVWHRKHDGMPVKELAGIREKYRRELEAM